jgi:hypothetical protein
VPLPRATRYEVVIAGNATALSGRRVTGSELSADGSHLTVASPPDGAVYLIDPTLRSEFQALPLKAIGTAGGTVEWIVDGRRFIRADARSAIDWALVAGRHVISVRDVHGHQAEAAIVVK